MSQERFAARLGTTRRRVIAWEGGENLPAARYLSRIAETTGRSTDFFLAGTDDEESRSVATPAVDDLVAALMRVIDERSRSAA